MILLALGPTDKTGCTENLTKFTIIYSFIQELNLKTLTQDLEFTKSI